MSLASSDNTPATIGVILKGYPRLSETFIAQEIEGLEARGLDLVIISLRHPTDRERHPVHERIRARVVYLPEYLWQEPVRVLKGLVHAVRRPGFLHALGCLLADFRHDPTPNRLRRFGQAVVLVREEAERLRHFYAHFLHTPASVARYAALMTGIPWSVSAHAKDIWTTPDREIAIKLREMRWLVTCTKVGRDRLAGLADRPDDVHLVYHGLDTAALPVAAGPSSEEQVAAGADGSDPDRPVRILSVGRAVPKKGYDDLLAAFSRLPAELNWRFEHIGGGAELERLRRQAETLGLSDRITWRGAAARDAVFAACRQSDIFVLASRIAGDGDRDGLPNVLMEAAWCGLACLSTRISAIPEFIEDGRSGLLVPERDPAALADGLERLIVAPALRAELAAALAARLNSDFSAGPGLDRIAALLAGR